MLTYIIGCIALIIKPGPDLMCTLATALSEGRTRAATLMAGLILGCWFWIVLLALGVASLFVAHPGVMTGIECVGTLFISYLAFGSLRDAWRTYRGTGADTLHSAQAKGWALICRGVAMSMSNPLTILFFLAFLPNFTREGSAHSPALQTFLLGSLFCALVPFVYMPVILAADALRAKLIGSTRFTVGLKLVSGLMLVAVVIILAREIRF